MRAIVLIPGIIIASGTLAQADDRPNVGFILSDDQSWGDYGFMGHPYLKTPHPDQLAGEGPVYERGYTTAATTVPIATGENLQGLEDCTRLIDKRAASILNLSPPNVGGLTEARRIATLAELRGIQIAPQFFSYGP